MALLTILVINMMFSMASWEKYYAPLGRVLLAVLFLYAGYTKITGFEGTAAFMGSVFVWPSVFLVVAIAFELLGGLSLLLGYRAKWGALALILFTVVATYAFHNPLKDPTQMVMLLKNLAIMGGLLYVAAHGAGRWSLDEHESA